MLSVPLPGTLNPAGSKLVIEVLTFSVFCDIISAAGSEGRTFDGNVMPDKTAG